jgi:hypothetical protein
LSTGAGQIVLDTDFDVVEQASSQKPICRVVANATQSIPDNTATALTFLQEDIDTHGFHSTSANTSRITPTVAGIYRFYSNCIIGGRTDYASVETHIRINGSTNLAPSDRQGNEVNAVAFTVQAEAWVNMNGTTDYAEAIVTQDNTANVAQVTNQSVNLSSVFMCEYMRSPG